MADRQIGRTPSRRRAGATSCGGCGAQTRENNLSIVAAGVAFYVMLAAFPAITAFVSLFGLFTDAAPMREEFADFKGVIPDDAWSLLNDQLTAVVTAEPQRLGLSVVAGLVIALWSAGAGVRAMMTALNIAYEEEEKRGFLRFYGTAFLSTIGIGVLGILSLGVIVAVPVLLSFIELGVISQVLAKLVPWLVLAGVVTVVLGALYRYGPSRREPKTRWVSWGAAVEALLWIGASILFSIYVANFSSYNETYGALGAVVILLMWRLHRAARSGAQCRDGASDRARHHRPPPEAAGRTGAYVADHVGEVP